MTITLTLLALLMALFVGWLISHSFNVRPWVAQSAHAGTPPALPESATAPRVGLSVLLAVIGALFALTLSAYMMRMDVGTDWKPLPEPALLWVNTGILLLASIALQWAWGAARHGKARTLQLSLAVGGVCTLAFVVGQYLAWRELSAAGYYMSANPANAFFFLLTGLHAVHLLGGLVAWANIMIRTRSVASTSGVYAAVELCAIYWHFLLVVWAVVFGVLLST